MDAAKYRYEDLAAFSFSSSVRSAIISPQASASSSSSAVSRWELFASGAEDDAAESSLFAPSMGISARGSSRRGPEVAILYVVWLVLLGKCHGWGRTVYTIESFFGTFSADV